MKFVELQKIDNIWNITNSNDESMNEFALFLIHIKLKIQFVGFLAWLTKPANYRKDSLVWLAINEHTLPYHTVGMTGLESKIHFISEKGNSKKMLELSLSNRVMKRIIETWYDISLANSEKTINHFIIKNTNNRIKFIINPALD